MHLQPPACMHKLFRTLWYSRRSGLDEMLAQPPACSTSLLYPMVPRRSGLDEMLSQPPACLCKLDDTSVTPWYPYSRRSGVDEMLSHSPACLCKLDDLRRTPWYLAPAIREGRDARAFAFCLSKWSATLVHRLVSKVSLVLPLGCLPLGYCLVLAAPPRSSRCLPGSPAWAHRVRLRTRALAPPGLSARCALLAATISSARSALTLPGLSAWAAHSAPLGRSTQATPHSWSRRTRH